jgi:hypothetical protein
MILRLPPSHRAPRGLVALGVTAVTAVTTLAPVAGVSCGGDPFVESDAGPVEAGVTGEASLDALRDGPVDGAFDAGTAWCVAQGMHTFCEDFSEGVPGKFQEELVGPPGQESISADNTDLPDAQTPPQSMLAVTPPLSALGDSASALGVASFTVDGLHCHLEAAIQVGKECYANDEKDGVTVALLTFPAQRYAIAVLAASTGPAVVEATYDADGGVMSAASHTLSGAFGADQWVTLTLDTKLSNVGVFAQTFSAALGADPGVKNEKLSLTPFDPEHPTLALGAGVKDTNSVSGGCRVHVDDVLLDIDTLVE